MAKGSVVVVDFDGTVYSRNSFPDWIKYCIVRSFKNLKFEIFFKLSFYLFLRKIFFALDHVSFKEKVDSIKYPPSWARDFCDKMEGSYNKSVVDMIIGLRPDTLIVSTAAPSCYAKYISNISGENIKDVICSESFEFGYANNYGQKKKEMTIKRLEGIKDFHGEFVFFTDHSSDIYLAEKASFVYLCNPEPEDFLFYKSKCVHVRSIGGYGESN